ncbi:MAG: phosphatidylglycerophosphatase A [Planctomycetota bacterium]|mgnify:CR=1 FL=1|nr:MAG: phosphatidylglycerophosphatase A [Planctomycetota bacterium]
MDNRDVAAKPVLARLCDWLLVAVATGFGVGLAPFAPGTWGSLLGLPLVWGLQAAHLTPLAVTAASIGVVLLGVAACNAACRHYGRKDPSQVVIDEIAAFPLVFAATSIDWRTATLGFLLFRVFDIWKPYPIRRFEQLPGGWGVMADDLIAALFAGGILWGVTHFVG